MTSVTEPFKLFPKYFKQGKGSEKSSFSVWGNEIRQTPLAFFATYTWPIDVEKLLKQIIPRLFIRAFVSKRQPVSFDKTHYR